MQAEWLKAGHPNPPEHEPPTPEDVTDPLERPDAIEGQIAAEPEAPALETAAPEPIVPPAPVAGPDADPVPPVPAPAPAQPKGWFARLSAGLKRSSDKLTTSDHRRSSPRKSSTSATLDDLEDILIAADLGIDTAMAITDRLRAEKFDKDISIARMCARCWHRKSKRCWPRSPAPWHGPAQCPSSS